MSTTTQNATKHPKYYLPHGDVIIQSLPGSNGISTLFRINKGVLAFSSPVFEGMFALPDSLSQDTYDGVPLVHFLDAADDISGLLSAFYDPT